MFRMDSIRRWLNAIAKEGDGSGEPTRGQLLGNSTPRSQRLSKLMQKDSQPSSTQRVEIVTNDQLTNKVLVQPV